MKHKFDTPPYVHNKLCKQFPNNFLPDICLKKSTIKNAGLGLFANKDIVKNKIITFYGGKNITSRTYRYLKRINGNKSKKLGYIYKINENNYLNGYPYENCNDKMRKKNQIQQLVNLHQIGQFCNDLTVDEKKEKIRKPNAIIADYCLNGTCFVFLLSLKNIKKNEEISVSYGKKYWKIFK